MEKGKIEKKAKNNHSIYLAILKVYTKFEYSGCNRSWECCDKIFIRKKEKWTNKMFDKQQHAVSLLHNTTSHIQHLYQISKSRRSSSWEIFDTNFPK